MQCIANQRNTAGSQQRPVAMILNDSRHERAEIFLGPLWRLAHLSERWVWSVGSVGLVKRVTLLKNRGGVEDLVLLLLSILGVVVNMLLICSLLILYLLIAFPSELVHVLLGSSVDALVDQESDSFTHVVRYFVELRVVILLSNAFNLFVLNIVGFLISFLSECLLSRDGGLNGGPVQNLEIGESPLDIRLVGLYNLWLVA